MKKVFKASLLAVALLAGVNVYAQDAPQFGIKAGASLSNFGGSDVNELNDKNAKFGFIGGITVDLPITENLYILSGLEFVTKGAKFESKGDIISASLKLNPTYLQLPIHIAYKIPVTETTKVVLGVGPYLAYGIGGKVKAEGSITSFNGSSEVDFFGDDGYAKRFDLGAGINAGLEFGKLGFSLGYDLGFLNILKKDNNKISEQFDDNSPSLRNQAAYLTVGYKF